MTRTEIVLETMKRMSSELLLFSIQKDIEDLLTKEFLDLKAYRGDLTFRDILVLVGRGGESEYLDTISHMIAAHFGDPTPIPPDTRSAFFIWHDTTPFSLSKTIQKKLVADMIGVEYIKPDEERFPRRTPRRIP